MWNAVEKVHGVCTQLPLHDYLLRSARNAFVEWLIQRIQHVLHVHLQTFQ